MLLANSEAPSLYPIFRCGCVVRLNLHLLLPLVSVSSALITNDAACTVTGVSFSGVEVWWTVSSHCAAGWKGGKPLLSSQSSSSIGEVPSAIVTGSNAAPGVHAYFPGSVAPSYTLRMRSMCSNGFVLNFIAFLSTREKPKKLHRIRCQWLQNL